MAKSSRYTFPVVKTDKSNQTLPAPVGGIVPSTTGENHGAEVITRDAQLALKRYQPKDLKQC